MILPPDVRCGSVASPGAGTGDFWSSLEADIPMWHEILPGRQSHLPGRAERFSHPEIFRPAVEEDCLCTLWARHFVPAPYPSIVLAGERLAFRALNLDFIHPGVCGRPNLRKAMPGERMQQSLQHFTQVVILLSVIRPFLHTPCTALDRLQHRDGLVALQTYVHVTERPAKS
jgi:hypothetical protein